MAKVTITIHYNDHETTPDYLVHQINGLEGVTDLEAHAPYKVVRVEGDRDIAVLPNRQAAEDTVRALGGDHYVTPDFTEIDIAHQGREPQVEVVHGRDPDSECSVTVFVNGERMTHAFVEDIDPGRGYQREDWDESIQYLRDNLNLSPDFIDFAVRTREEFASSQYITD